MGNRGKMTTVRAKVLVLGALGLAHLLASVFAVVPGYLSIDEVTYDLMTRDLARHGSLEIHNGYEDFPSPELGSMYIRPMGGGLVAQYPYGFSFLGLGAYGLTGFRGLFFINAIAFAGTVTITGLLAMALFRDRELALNAALVLALCTYLWDYSQAAWPHAVSTFFILASFYAAAPALRAPHDRPGLGPAFISGLLGMAAVTVRLDALFALPAIAVLFVLARPMRLRALAALAVGWIPGIAFLSATNHVRFGTWMPLSYGTGTGYTGAIWRYASGLDAYLPLIAAGALVVAVAWLGSRPWAVRRLQGRARTVIAAAIVFAVLSPAFAPVRRFAWTFAAGFWQIVVDLRVRGHDVIEPALTRSPGGGLVYAGALKKSLLQSCPYLVAIVVPLAGAVRGRWSRPVVMLLPVPVLFVAVFSYLAWHGGLCLNLRYLLPVLPFASILVALAWRELPRGEGKRAGLWLAGGAVAAAIVFLTAQAPALQEIEYREFFFLTFPLLLALAILLCLGILATPFSARLRLLPGFIRGVLAAALTWAACVVFLHDVPWARRIRAENLAIATAVRERIVPDSIIFTAFPDQVYGVADMENVWIALPFQDEFRDFRPLMEAHLDAGRPVYGAFLTQTWRELREGGFLDGTVVDPLWDDRIVKLGRIRRVMAEDAASL